MDSSNKKYIIALVVIVVGALGYYFYISGSPSASADASLDIAPGQDQIGSQVLTLLNTVKTLHIDPTFFKNAIFQSLTDNTVPIPQENVGRTNPFAPIAGAAEAVAPSPAVPVVPAATKPVKKSH